MKLPKLNNIWMISKNKLNIILCKISTREMNSTEKICSICGCICFLSYGRAHIAGEPEVIRDWTINCQEESHGV